MCSDHLDGTGKSDFAGHLKGIEMMSCHSQP